MHERFWRETPKKKAHLEELGIHGRIIRIILACTLKLHDWMSWNGFVFIRIWKICSVVKTVMNIRVP
jgi:hypothetical protein